jgi:ornithine carbamoyltransferase
MPPCEPYALELEQVGCQTRQERRRVRSSALSNGLAAQRNHEPETSDLLALTDLGVSEVMTIIERAQDMAAFWNQRRMVQSLAGRRFALVVNDSGWRNTTAFDLGIQAMGGICAHAPLRWDAREDLADLAAYLDNWLDGIVTRAPDLSVIRRLASAARAPVINARTRQNHPCESLGDLAFHLHRHGHIEGMQVGIVSPISDILGSWIEAAAVLPINVVQVYPDKWHDREAAASTPRFRTSIDINELVDADIIVTDCWPLDAESEHLLDYQITLGLLDKLHPRADFVPCPPVSRGKEVSADAMMHPACRVIEAKAFLLPRPKCGFGMGMRRPLGRHECQTGAPSLMRRVAEYPASSSRATSGSSQPDRSTNSDSAGTSQKCHGCWKAAVPR